MRSYLRPVLCVLAALCMSSLVTATIQDGTTQDGTIRDKEEKPVELAVVVNAKNPIPGLSLRKLKSYFKQNSEFWPNKVPCKLFFRPSKSVEMEILLDRVYGMSYRRLIRRIQTRFNSSLIKYRPKILNTDQDAIREVTRGLGVFTVIRADRLPKKTKGFRVLAIDGKKPGQEGYPLVSRTKDSSLAKL